jgi:hypothetical protein
MLLFVIVSVEASAQLLYRLRYGEFAWKGPETFRIRSFTRLVEDSRHATTIANFSDPNYGGYGISIDAYGFRRGAQITIPDCPSVSRCVINAAIPSYSLFQAVARFEREILGKFKIDSVYLQIYDPVTQFVRFGAQWTPEMDWTTEPATKSWEPKRQYIASIAIIRKTLFRFGVLKMSEPTLEDIKPVDERTLERYRVEIRRELEHLHDIIVQAHVKRLVVAPVTVPSGAYQQLSKEYRIAIEAMNDELKEFATRNDNTTFFDTARLLKSHPDSEMFIDECCHLTELGSDLVAEGLIKILNR